MSILDVTEDQIFQTLGKGKDPNFKQIEKVRPLIARPKEKVRQTIAKPKEIIQPVVQPVITVPENHIDESLQKLSEDFKDLNNRFVSLQKMVQWYIVPQFIVVIVLLLVIAVRANS